MENETLSEQDGDANQATTPLQSNISVSDAAAEPEPATRSAKEGHADESVRVSEADWASEIDRIRGNRLRILRFAASATHGVAKKAALTVGLGALTGNLNVGAMASSNMKDDVGKNVVRPDCCCLCGLNPATKTFVLTRKVENLAGTLLGGPVLGEQTVFTEVGYCESCEAYIKDLPGISLTEYGKVDGAWRLALTFKNDRVAREYYRLNVDRVLDQIWAATIVGDVDAVALLLDAGTPVDVRSEKGTTPLHISAEFGDTEMMDLLIGRGADVDASSLGGSAPLHMAALWGGLPVTERLLAAGAHVDPANTDGITPLHIACEQGHVEVADTLLTHGANASALSAKGRTTAMFAASHPQIQELLRKYVAPAEWYPDPVGRHEYRYWDGSKWTDHVSDGGEQGLDPTEPSTGLS